MRRCLVAGGVGSHVLGIQMLTAPSWAATLQSGSLGGRHRGQPHSKVAVSVAVEPCCGACGLDHIGSYWIILDHWIILQSMLEHVGSCEALPCSGGRLKLDPWRHAFLN